MPSQPSPILEALEPLSEVPGWASSAVLSADGTIIAQNGEGFPAEAAGALATRISRLFESFASTGAEASTALLKFSGQTLLIRPVLDCYLVAVAKPNANLPMLKTGMAMSVKRMIDFAKRQQEQGGGEEEEPGAEPESSPDPDPVGYQRVYRGIRIG